MMIICGQVVVGMNIHNRTPQTGAKQAMHWGTLMVLLVSQILRRFIRASVRSSYAFPLMLSTQARKFLFCHLSLVEF